MCNTISLRMPVSVVCYHIMTAMIFKHSKHQAYWPWYPHHIFIWFWKTVLEKTSYVLVHHKFTISNCDFKFVFIAHDSLSSFFYVFYTAQLILYWGKDILVFYLPLNLYRYITQYEKKCAFLFVIAWLCCCRPSVEWWVGAGASGPQRETRWSCCSSGTGTAVVLQQANNMWTTKKESFRKQRTIRGSEVFCYKRTKWERKKA